VEEDAKVAVILHDRRLGRRDGRIGETTDHVKAGETRDRSRPVSLVRRAQLVDQHKVYGARDVDVRVAVYRVGRHTVLTRGDVAGVVVEDVGRRRDNRLAAAGKSEHLVEVVEAGMAPPK